MTIALHIERLILDGLPLNSAQAAQVEAAVIAQLRAQLHAQFEAQRVSNNATLSHGETHFVVRSNPIRIGLGSSPPTIGAQIGKAIHGSIAPTSSSARPSGLGTISPVLSNRNAL